MLFCNENPFDSKHFSHSSTGIEQLRVLLKGIHSEIEMVFAHYFIFFVHLGKKECWCKLHSATQKLILRNDRGALCFRNYTEIQTFGTQTV